MEFKVAGNHYQTRKLNAFEQFALARRFADVLAVLAMSNDQAKLKERFAQAFCALTSKLSSAEVQAGIKECLGCVSRKHEDSFVPVMSGDSIMFADVHESMPIMLEIVYFVLEGEGLIRFFSEPELSSKTPGKKRL